MTHHQYEGDSTPNSTSEPFDPLDAYITSLITESLEVYERILPIEAGLAAILAATDTLTTKTQLSPHPKVPSTSTQSSTRQRPSVSSTVTVGHKPASRCTITPKKQRNYNTRHRKRRFTIAGGLLSVIVAVLGAVTYRASYIDPALRPGAIAADTTAAYGVANEVIWQLNRRDIDGVVVLMCSRDATTGRRKLARVIPALDSHSPPHAGNTTFEFDVSDVQQVPEGYRAEIVVHHAGVTQKGVMFIQRDGSRWTLCGFNSPQIDGTVPPRPTD